MPKEAETEPAASTDYSTNPLVERSAGKGPERGQDIPAAKVDARRAPPPMPLDFEQFFQVIQTVARQVSFDSVRVVLASTDGDVRFLEVLENPAFRTELQDVLRGGLLPLGILGWRMTAGSLAAKGMLFPWHKDDEILRELFRHLCKEAVGYVGEALNEAMMKWEDRRPSPWM